MEDLKTLEKDLKWAMVRLMVRYPDGLELIENYLSDVLYVGKEMGVGENLQSHSEVGENPTFH